MPTPVEDEWTALIDSEDSRRESVLQQFLEGNPSLLPGARTLDTNSGHPPWPHAVVSQPPLPDLSTKRPDFMWIAQDSAYLYPILIEIETPWKRWYHESSLQQHSDLTTPLTQVTHWRRWFNNAPNQTAFYRYYRVPREMQDLKLEPRYLVVHGRRNEASGTPAAAEYRGALPLSADTKVVTFDHLNEDPRAASYFTVGVDENGFHLHPNSPHPDPSTLSDDVIREVDGLEGSALPRRGYRHHPPPRRAARGADQP